jgi:hypothetical protein
MAIQWTCQLPIDETVAAQEESETIISDRQAKKLLIPYVTQEDVVFANLAPRSKRFTIQVPLTLTSLVAETINKAINGGGSMAQSSGLKTPCIDHMVTCKPPAMSDNDA